MKNFGQRFREARISAGLTQDDVAAVCRNEEGEIVNKTSVSNWEKEKNRPSLDNFVAAITLIGPQHADVGYILGLTEANAAAAADAGIRPASREEKRRSRVDRIAKAVYDSERRRLVNDSETKKEKGLKR
jgi:transcriptional regulator with XRE-family HTH domain